MQPHVANVDDHVLRVMEWPENARDLVGTSQDSNTQIRSNRINEVIRP